MNECKVCGYKQGKDWLNEDPYKQVTVGDEKFIEIKGSFYIDKETEYSNHRKEVSLIACPKCKTVILDYNEW